MIYRMNLCSIFAIYHINTITFSAKVCQNLCYVDHNHQVPVFFEKVGCHDPPWLPVLSKCKSMPESLLCGYMRLIVLNVNKLYTYIPDIAVLPTIHCCITHNTLPYYDYYPQCIAATETTTNRRAFAGSSPSIRRR